MWPSFDIVFFDICKRLSALCCRVFIEHHTYYISAVCVYFQGNDAIYGEIYGNWELDRSYMQLKSVQYNCTCRFTLTPTQSSQTVEAWILHDITLFILRHKSHHSSTPIQLHCYTNIEKYGLCKKRGAFNSCHGSKNKSGINPHYFFGLPYL